MPENNCNNLRDPLFAKQCFNRIKRETSRFLAFRQGFEKVKALDFLIDLIGQELVLETSVELFNADEEPDRNLDIPADILIAPEEQKKFSLAGVNVAGAPYSIEKYSNSVDHIQKEGFDQSKNITQANYYPELNLALVFNGRHHLNIAGLIDVPTADVQIYRLLDTVGKIRTDGAYWYVRGSSSTPVDDYRLAVLYDLFLQKVELVDKLGLDDGVWDIRRKR